MLVAAFIDEEHHAEDFLRATHQSSRACGTLAIQLAVRWVIYESRFLVSSRMRKIDSYCTAASVYLVRNHPAGAAVDLRGWRPSPSAVAILHRPGLGPVGLLPGLYFPTVPTPAVPVGLVPAGVAVVEPVGDMAPGAAVEFDVEDVDEFGVFEAAVTGAMVVDDLFPAPAGGALAGIGFGVGVGVVPGAAVVVDGLAVAAFVPGVGVWASSNEAATDRAGSSIWGLQEALVQT